MITETQIPTRKERAAASESLKILGVYGTLKSKGSRKKSVRIKIEESKETVELPKAALEMLTAILSHMSEGKAISIVPSEVEITTQQAAEILNVSRPFIVKLLENGNIPFKKVGSHRRLKLKDLEAYREKERAKQQAAIQDLADITQELGI
jgi:excisionase family DNA binding protein